MRTIHGFNIVTPSGTAQRVSTGYFLEYVLPPLPPGLDVERVVASIRRTGKKCRRLITQQGYWRGFSDEPQSTTRGKSATFAHLTPIANSICNTATARGFVPTMQLVQHLPEEENRSGDAALPDGCVVPIGTQQETWEDIAAVGWYSKYEDVTHSSKVVERIERSFKHCMNNPRRRFIFGYTLLNADLELWYMDRTQWLVSEPIEWITDHSAMVRFLVALLFAQPYQLGWDTTITTCTQGGDPQYDIVVEDAHGSQTLYRTLALLASSQSETNGKGTRVWRAVELRNGMPHGDPVILKDVWRHGELVQEGSIIESIRDSITSEEDRVFLDDHLPTVLHHGDVVIHPDSAVDPPHLDSSQTHMRNIQCLCAGQQLDEPALLLPGTRLGPYCSTTFGSIGRSESGEDCLPIHREKSSATIFTALADVANVTRIMHKHGWVHRDLSYGNILLDSKGRMRLIDFEFAKQYANEKVPEFRVGTSSFMAAEVHDQAFLFEPRSAPSNNLVKILSKRYPLLDGDDDDFELVPLEVELATPPFSEELVTSIPKSSFYYSPLHDLESVWWVAGYFVFDHARRLHWRDACKDAKGKLHRSARAYFPEELFEDVNKRYNVMRITGHFASYASILPQSLRPAAAALEKLRRELMTAYEETEKNEASISKPAFAGLHNVFADAMLSIANIVSATSKTESTARTALSNSRKRSRKDDTPISPKTTSVDTKRPRVA